MKKFLISACSTVALIMILSLSACGDDGIFRIKGTIGGNPTMNLRVVYYGDNSLQTVITAARDGKFEFSGSSKRPALVEIFDNDYRLVGQLYASNGDEITCSLDRSNPDKITATGNIVCEQWAGWLNENAEALHSNTPEQNNALVAKYIAANKESVVSTLLFITKYDASSDPVRADSILSSISINARPASIIDGYNTLLLQRVTTSRALDEVISMKFATACDSTFSYNPSRQSYSLLVFSNERSLRSDSIVPVLRKLHEKEKDRVMRIVDISLHSDTLSWHRDIASDSAEWTQVWAPGGITAKGVERLGLPRLPYFLVVDSTGQQIYRGASLTDACNTVNDKLKSR